MESDKKCVLLVVTVFLTLLTVWFSIPAFSDIWINSPTRVTIYSIGFILGVVTGLCWASLLYGWTKS